MVVPFLFLTLWPRYKKNSPVDRSTSGLGWQGAARRGPNILEERYRAGLRVPAAHAHAYLLLLVVATSAVRGLHEHQSIDFTLFSIVVVVFPSFTITFRRRVTSRRLPPTIRSSLASQSTFAESGRCQRSLDVTDVRHVVRKWGYLLIAIDAERWWMALIRYFSYILNALSTFLYCIKCKFLLKRDWFKRDLIFVYNIRCIFFLFNVNGSAWGGSRDDIFGDKSEYKN